MQSKTPVPKLQVAAKAIIVDSQGRVLILRESAAHDTNTKAGKYQFPGGRLEPGEPFLEGLQREVQEETGLSVTPEYPFQIGEWWPVIKGVAHQIVAVFVVCQATAAEVRLSEEHDAYQWVDTAIPVDGVVMDPDAAVLAAYLASLTDESKEP